MPRVLCHVQNQNHKKLTNYSTSCNLLLAITHLAPEELL